MSLQSWCNYSAVAAHVLWEGEGREKGEGEKNACKKRRRELFMLNGRVRQIERALQLEG